MKNALAFLKQYASPVESTSPKVNNFNIIRFIAAFMVVHGHMSVIMGQPKLLIVGSYVSTFGVRIFFLISGYLITKSYLSDNHFGRYMIRRTFRIFPALIVATLLCVFVLGPVMTTLSLPEYFTSPATWKYFKNLIFNPQYVLPGVFADNVHTDVVNGSIWTLPIEFAMYLILPLLVLLFKKLGSIKWGMAACALISLVVSLCYILSNPRWVFVAHGSNLCEAIPLLPYFFIGSVCSFPEVKKIFNLQLASVLMILACFLIVKETVAEVVHLIVIPYFILSLALAERPIFSKWFSKCDFSYGIYLYGFPIQQLLWSLLRDTGISILPMTLLSFFVILLVAIASWYLVEKPMQKLAQKWIARIGKKKTAA